MTATPLVGFWSRVLHDRTSAELTKVLSNLDNVNVTIVPFRLRRHGRRGFVPVPAVTTGTGTDGSGPGRHPTMGRPSR
jgi:hypothetical protein